MIRTLRHGELPPEGVEPRRYKNSQGYIRLRWSTGHGDYVECYEHRWVMGNPPPDVEVHHVNHVKDDNRPENLKVVTPTEHGAEHRGIDRDEAIRLYRAGYGVSQSVVLSRLCELGVPRRRAGRSTAAQVARAEAAIAEAVRSS